eukprot:7144057-Prymnesium_polylepis.1
MGGTADKLKGKLKGKRSKRFSVSGGGDGGEDNEDEDEDEEVGEMRAGGKGGRRGGRGRKSGRDSTVGQVRRPPLSSQRGETTCWPPHRCIFAPAEPLTPSMTLGPFVPRGEWGQGHSI